MARHRVANPLKYVDEIGPKVRQRRQEFTYEKGSLLKEAPMPGPNPMKVENVSGTVTSKTGNVSVLGPEIKPPPLRLQTET